MMELNFFDQVAVMNNQELLARFIEINQQIKKKNKEVDDLKTEKAIISDRIMEMFIDLGVQSMKVGKITVYLHKQLWAGTGDDCTSLDVVRALEKLGMDSYVSYNIQSMSGYVREEIQKHEEWIDKEGKLNVSVETVLAGLPEPLSKVLKITEKIILK